MVLDMIDGQDMDWAEAVRQAAQATGGEVLFVLPDADEDGSVRSRAMVRLTEDETQRLVVIAERDGGYEVKEEPEIDDDLVQFARASIDVLERLAADAAVVAPLAEQQH